jgi:hypothetical protein
MSVSNGPIIRLWTDAGFIGLRLGQRYFKLRDTERHPLMFSERNGHNYRRLARIGSWEIGVRFDA